jgi:hypothetical protein
MGADDKLISHAIQDYNVRFMDGSESSHLPIGYMVCRESFKQRKLSNTPLRL